MRDRHRPNDTLVVVHAANPWREHRMADHQLAEALSEYARVLYVDPPTSVVPRLRAVSGETPRLLAVSDRLTVLRPLSLPGVRQKHTAAVNSRLLAGQVRRACKTLGARDITLLEADVATPVIGMIGEASSVYWAQDDWRGLADLVGVDPGVYARGELRARRLCDAIIAANPTVAATNSAVDKPLSLIPFGCDSRLFGTARSIAPAKDGCPDRSPAIVMGSINDRLDMDILHAVAERGVPLLLVGPRTDSDTTSSLDALFALDNVRWIGARDFAAMPAYLAGASVGLVPYTHSTFNEGSFPLKTLEYLAAGLPVVATDLPGTRWLASPDICITDDSATFAEAVASRQAAGVPSQAAADRRLAFAKQHDWRARAEAFLDVIETATRS